MKLHTVDSTSGAKAQNVEFFGTDLDPRHITDGALRYIVTVSSNEALIQITLDSGTTWTELGTPDSNKITSYTFYVRDNDQVNFRTNDEDGITLDFFRVDCEI